MKPKNPFLRSSLFTTLCVAMTLPAVQAATWDGAPDASGSSADANWSTATNWVGDVAPVVLDALIFDGAVQTTNVNDIADNTEFTGLTFAAGAGAFIATGNALRIEGNISNSSSNDQDFSAINFNIQNANRTIYVEDGTTLTMGDLLAAGGGAHTHTKTGLGTLKLTADGFPSTGRNSGDYTHAIVDAGTLQVDANATENRQTIDSVTVNDGGTLKLGNGARTPINPFTGLLYSHATINIGGTFDLNGHQGIDARVQSLNGTGGLVTNTSGSDANLIIAGRSNNAVVTFPGVIEDGDGGGYTGVEIDYGGQNGGRVNVFTGTNTYSGNTQVSDQSLIINGDHSECYGDVLVPSANTARLGGYGTIGGDVYIGCIICPGDASGADASVQLPGKLTILGVLNFDPAVQFFKYEDGTNRGGTRHQEYDFSLTDWGSGLTAGIEYDTIDAAEIVIGSTPDYKLNINVEFSGDAVTNFDDSAQTYTLATSTDGIPVEGLSADNWQVNVTGVAAAGVWTVETSVDELSLLLSYEPADVSADVVWDGGGADNNVSTAANWEGDILPVPPQSIGFAGSTRTTPVNDANTNTSIVVNSDIIEFDAIVYVADSTGILVGQTVTGTGIPADTTVASVDSATQFTLSNPAEATDPAVDLTFTTFGNAQVNGIAFLSGASSFTLTGNALNMGDASENAVRVINDSTNAQSIELDLDIASNSNQIWAKSGEVEISGSISASGNRTITSIGTNTTTLSGTTDNAYLQVQALEGTMVLGKDSSPTVHAASNVNMSASAAGTVQLGGTGGDQIYGSITMNGGFFDLNGIDETVANLNSASDSTGVITNNLAATTATLTLSGTNGTDYQTIVDGAGAVAMVYESTTNAQTQIVANNTYSGGTTINGSSLRIEMSTPIGSGPVTFLGDAAANSTLFIPSSGSAYTGNVMPNSLIVNSPNIGRIRWGKNQTLPGTLTGDGTLAVAHENRNYQGTTVTGDWSAFTGTVLFRGGDSSVEAGTTNFTHLTLSATGLPSAIVTMQSDLTGPPNPAGTNKHLRIVEPNGTVPIGDLNSDGNAIAGTLVAYNNTAGTGTFEVGGLGLTSTFEGTIRDGNASNLTALTKVGAGTWTLTDVTSSYSGATAVDGGTLSIVHDLADGAGVRVATGAVLDLAVANDVVDSLWLDGSQVDSGTYGPVGSGAANQSIHFTGTGYLSVTNDAPAGYAGWAAINAGGETADLDFDNDGTQNGIEYFLNAAAGFTSGAPSVVGGTMTWSNGGNITPDQYGTQYVVQTSIDLVTWGDVALGDLDLNDATTLTYTLPTGLEKNFVRLVVTPN